MRFRYAEHGDLAALAKLHVNAWRAAYRGMISSSVLDALDVSHAFVRLEPVIDASPPRIGVAESDDHVVAFCRFGPSRESDVPPHSFEIFALNVEPNRWRSGAGRFIVEHVLAEANARGFTTCTLWVLTANTRARNFYEAMGFDLDGATRTEAASSDYPLHEVRYRRAL